VEILTKHSTSRQLTEWETSELYQTRMTIGVTSRQLGERTDFGWSVCYKRGNDRPFFGGGAGSVMKTSSQPDQIQGELNATRAAILTLRRLLLPSWSTQQLKMTILSANKSTLQTLEKVENNHAQPTVEVEQKLGNAARHCQRPRQSAAQTKAGPRRMQSTRTVNQSSQRKTGSISTHPRPESGLHNLSAACISGKIKKSSATNMTEKSSCGTHGRSSALT
jgi:hypothetical protein